MTGDGYGADGEIVVIGDKGLPAGDSASLRWTLVVGAACNDAGLSRTGVTWDVVGDPTEAALLVAAHKGGIDDRDLATTLPRVSTIPFASERQYMATLHERPSGEGPIVLLKGSTERVSAQCAKQMCGDGSEGAIDSASIMAAAEALAGAGLRLLAMAVGGLEDPVAFEPDAFQGELVFTGLEAMFNPPRAAARAALHLHPGQQAST